MFRLLQTVFPRSAGRLTTPALCQAVASATEAVIVALLVPLLAAVGTGASDVGLPRIAALESFRVTVPQLLVWLTGAFVVRAAMHGAAVASWSAGVEYFETLHREKLLRGLLSADVACQSRETSGRLQHLLTHHTESAARAYTALAWSGAHLIQVACLTLSAWILSPRPALVTILALSSIVALLRPLTKLGGAAAKRRAAALAGYVHGIGQCSSLLNELRIYGAAEAYLQRSSVASDAIARERRRQNFVGSILPTLYQTSAGLFLLAGAAAIYFITGAAGTAPVVSLLLLLRASSAAQHLHVTYHQLQDARPSLEELVELEARYDSSKVPTGGLPLARIERLELRGASFAYEADRPILSDVDFEIRRGDVVGIIGPSGAGKSTLIQLLLALRTPNRGSMLLNGMPFELFCRDEFYARSAFVAQEPAFFNESVAACIRFGRESLVDSELEAAARAAGLLEDITRMPLGFEQSVGERGALLSLGQRQRLSIARALVGEPDLLVFDEPTAALDADTEETIVATLAALRGRAITFVVTHRPALLRACNKVLHVADGGVRIESSASGGRNVAETTAAA